MIKDFVTIIRFLLVGLHRKYDVVKNHTNTTPVLQINQRAFRISAQYIFISLKMNATTVHLLHIN